MIYKLKEVTIPFRDTQRVVLCHGCFDLIHTGHINHLRSARALGDALVVGVTEDEYVGAAKGENRPLMSAADRAKILDAFEMVDDVIIVDDASAIPVIEAVHPHIYVKGDDYLDALNDPKLISERETVERFGGRLEFIGEKLHSSSALIAQSRFSKEIFEYSNQLKSAGITYSQISQLLDEAKTYVVSTIGEPILDKYIYVSPAGKSMKDNTIAHRVEGSMEFDGGISIINAHLNQACKDITSWIDPDGIVIKTRHVDVSFNDKLFSSSENTRVTPFDVAELKDSADFVCVGDFGHGLIPDNKTAWSIRAWAKFLAITVQSNSLNWGFNTIRKWHSPDYLVIDEAELRLGLEDQTTDVKELIHKVDARIIIVTLGHKGCIARKGTEVIEAPALATEALDRMGAGDAFLSWSAPLAFIGAPLNVIALVGSIAGAIQVGIVGNSRAITRSEINSWLERLLV